MATPRSLLGYRQPTLLGYRQQGPTWTQDETDAAAVQRAEADRGSNAITQAWQSTSSGLNAGDLSELALAADQAGDTAQRDGLLRRMRVAQQVAAVQRNDVAGIEDIKLGEEGGIGRAANWFGGALGSMGRSAAPTVAAGVAGAGAGALVGSVLPGPGTVAGAVAGGLRGLVAAAPAAIVSYDQLRGEQVAQQFDDPEVMKRSADERARVASLTAAAQTLPEMIVPMRGVGAMIGRGTTPALRREAVEAAVKNRPLDVLKDTVTEAGTETLQTEMSYQGQQALGSVAERNPMD
jgi:hypothetical protein